MSTKSFSAPGYPLPDPELFFLASDHEIYDYRNLYAFTAWLGDQLKSYPVGEEKPVLFFAGSSNRQVFAFAACWLLQQPFISLSPGMTDSELEEILSRIEPAVAITDPENRERLGKIPSLPIPDFKLSMRESVDTSRFSNEVPEKLIGYFLTSGSTGAPKIVPLKRRQILFAARASGENFKPAANRYWLLCMPLNHTGGISIIIRCILYRAAVYRLDRFDEEQIITFLSENKLFQVASMVPTMLNRLMSHPRFRVHVEFQALLLGGGPITPSLIRQAIERGIPAVASYGMTETCGQIAANPFLKPSGIYHPKKSVGRIFKPNSAEIRDENGKALPANEAGILWLKGPQVFDGYPDKVHNRDKFDKNGWFRTDDFGHLNREKQLFIHARRTDLILTGGENVNPYEVESALEELNGIQEAAVTGIADAEWGQVVIAFITSSAGQEPDEETLKSGLRKRLSPYKIPKRIIPVQGFPRTESGKIHKRKLAESFEGKVKINTRS